MSSLRNIILISLDSVCREALSCYDKHFPWWKTIPTKPKTAHIDRIARDGTLFTQTICQAPYTPASHASILTGLNPYNHGIRGIIGYKISEKVTALAEILKENSFKTGAFIGSHALGSQYGLDRGFDIYDEDFDSPEGRSWILGYRRPGSEVTDKALAWLRRQDEKFFLFLHYFDAHDATIILRQKKQKISKSRRLGQNLLLPIRQRLGSSLRPMRKFIHRIRKRKVYGIRYHLNKVHLIDTEVGRIAQYLKEENMYDDTCIIITSDHGDSFGEHGESNHREFLYDTTLRIPLIIKGSQNYADGIVTNLTRSTDIFPTIIEMLEFPSELVDGISLIKFMNQDSSKELKAYSETRCGIDPFDAFPIKSHYESLRSQEWKFIINRINGKKEFYDLKTDPRERNNILLNHEETAKRLEEELEHLVKHADKPKPGQMSPEETETLKKRLRSLGYL